MVGLSCDGDSLRSLLSQNNPVAEGGSDFFKSLLLCFAAQMCKILVNLLRDAVVREIKRWGYIREEKVCNDEEKGGTNYKHVVVVLVNGSKCARSGFGDYFWNLHQRSLSYQSELRFRAEREGLSYWQH